MIEIHFKFFRSRGEAQEYTRRWRRAHKGNLPKPLRGHHGITFGTSDWFKECGSKIGHRSLHSAIQQITELKLKPAIHNTGGAWLTVYLCRWCEWFHVGHSTEKWEHERSTVYSEKGMDHKVFAPDLFLP
jgi:hypothetical protein